MRSHRAFLAAAAFAAAAPARAQDPAAAEPSPAVRSAAARIEHLPYWGRSAAALAAPLGAGVPVAGMPLGPVVPLAGGSAGGSGRQAIAAAVLAAGAAPDAKLSWGQSAMAFGAGKRIAAAEQALGEWGLPARDLASAAAFAFVTDWRLAAGRPLDGEAAGAAARAMAARFAGAAPDALGALDASGRAAAYEAMLGHAQALAEVGQRADGALAEGVRQAAAACFQRQFGIAPSAVRLDRVPTAMAGNAPAGDAPKAAGGGLLGGGLLRGILSGGSDSAAAASPDTSAANSATQSPAPPARARAPRAVGTRDPVGAVLKTEFQYDVGTGGLAPRIHLWFLYAGGGAADCDEVDPTTLDLSPGVAHPAPPCDAARWSQRGDRVWLQTGGDAPEDYGELLPPAPARLEFDGSYDKTTLTRPAGSGSDASVGDIHVRSGATTGGVVVANTRGLRLTADGRFSGFAVHTSGMVTNTSTTRGATAGRYAIDGYVLTMTLDDGTVVRRPIVFMPPDSSHPGAFLFFEGRQYADEGRRAR